ncbi:KRAB-A domain-containing protein 2-like [Myzus persicae]|uniref:KRAB-A domain-containing protein 2-like n=2 Tax=Myzus persicae TaxID=13164 RepID=UPI000B939CD0|nr:KRAB-A domain-containing protein 2-like [Myzus persicae]XP_022174573.1 KRAB-A domain-containing protein 2-like [Myzus persicae]
MENKFRAEIDKIISSKKRDDNIFYFSSEEYNNKIQKIKELKIGTLKKTVTNNRLIRKYDVVSIGGKEKLIKPIVDNESDVLYYVTVDELFEVIHTAHLAVGHGGRNRMMAVLKTKYCNVTTEAVMAYLGLCSNCQVKQSNPKRGLVTKPILHSAFNSRAQIDLIDMQSQNYNNYRYIMNYQDHLTKFVILKPLKTKRAEEIALNLIDIYTIFGAPAILHSDNGREFVNSIITNLNEMWGDVKIVHGKPRHSQTQGSIERANRDVEEILASWMADNKSKDWPMALKFVQFQKNRALNSGIGRSPYEAMFGCTARTGLASAGIPYDEIEKLKSEEDIEELFNNSNHSDHINAVEDDLVDVGDLDNEVNLETENELRNTKDIGKRIEKIKDQRQKSVVCLEKQASKMLRLTNEKFSKLDVGTTVRVPIPDVDRARGSPRNLLAVIISCEDDMYKLCTEYGVLKHKYTRAQISPCKEKFLELDEAMKKIKDREITLREAAGHGIAGHQGFNRCNCKTGCGTKKCACNAAEMLCSSKCHGNQNCTNK